LARPLALLYETLGVLDQPRCQLRGARDLRCLDLVPGAAHTEAVLFAQDMVPAASSMPVLPAVTAPSADIFEARLCTGAVCRLATLVDPARVPELAALLQTLPPHEATLWRAGNLTRQAPTSRCRAPGDAPLQIPVPRDAPCAESSFRVGAAACVHCPGAMFLLRADASSSACRDNASAVAAALPAAERPGPGYELFFGGYYES
jgi:hypothetical protein